MLSVYARPNVFTVYAHLSPHVGNVRLSGVVVLSTAAVIFISGQDGFSILTNYPPDYRVLDDTWSTVNVYYESTSNTVFCTKGSISVQWDPLTDNLTYPGPLLTLEEQDYLADLCKNYHKHHYNTGIVTAESNVVGQRFPSNAE